MKRDGYLATPNLKELLLLHGSGVERSKFVITCNFTILLNDYFSAVDVFDIKYLGRKIKEHLFICYALTTKDVYECMEGLETTRLF